MTAVVAEFHSNIRRAKRLYERFENLAKGMDNVGKIKQIDTPEYASILEDIKNLGDPNSQDNIKNYESLLASLKEIPGPFIAALHAAMANNKVKGKPQPVKIWPGHAGSFTGKSAFALLKSESIPLFMKKCEFNKFGSEEKVYIGNDEIAEMFVQRAKLIQKELQITTSMRSFCKHMKANLKIVNGEIGRQNHILFPSHITLLSEHTRTHILDDLKKFGDLKASERGTERMNQELIKIQNQVKKIPDQNLRGNKMVERIQIQRVAKPVLPMFTKTK